MHLLPYFLRLMKYLEDIYSENDILAELYVLEKSLRAMNYPQKACKDFSYEELDK